MFCIKSHCCGWDGLSVLVLFPWYPLFSFSASISAVMQRSSQNLELPLERKGSELCKGFVWAEFYINHHGLQAVSSACTKFLHKLETTWLSFGYPQITPYLWEELKVPTELIQLHHQPPEVFSQWVTPTAGLFIQIHVSCDWWLQHQRLFRGVSSQAVTRFWMEPSAGSSELADCCSCHL